MYTTQHILYGVLYFISLSYDVSCLFTVCYDVLWCKLTYSQISVHPTGSKINKQPECESPVKIMLSCLCVSKVQENYFHHHGSPVKLVHTYSSAGKVRDSHFNHLDTYAAHAVSYEAITEMAI